MIAAKSQRVCECIDVMVHCRGAVSVPISEESKTFVAERWMVRAAEAGTRESRVNLRPGRAPRENWKGSCFGSCFRRGLNWRTQGLRKV